MTRMTSVSDVMAERALDQFLVVASRNGNRHAFEQLARRWQPRLIAHAWRLTGDREAARDAVQGSWVEIARGLGRLRDEQAFPAWVYRIVSRRCARFIAGRQDDRTLMRGLAREAAISSPDGAPLAEVASTDEARRLHIAIRGLPPVQRAAIALFHFEEMTVSEVAVALDTPAGTIKTRLMHARRALRAVLEGEDHA